MHNAKKLSDSLIIQPSYEVFLNDAPIMINVALVLLEVHPIDQRRVILVRPLDDRCVGLDHFAGQGHLLGANMIVVLREWDVLALGFLLQGVDYCGLSFLCINVIFEQRFIYLILAGQD